MGEREPRPLEAFEDDARAADALATDASATDAPAASSRRAVRFPDGVDVDGDGVPDLPRHGTVAEEVEAILFDLDNTLIDFLRVKKVASEACARAMIAAGADFGETPEDVAKMLFSHYLAHGIESDDAFQTFLRRYQRNKFAYNQHQMDKVLAAGINAYLRAKDTMLTTYPRVQATLVELLRRGYRLAIVTDAPRVKAWQRLWAVGIAELFDVVVTRTDSGQSKPHRSSFLTALDALGVPAHKAAMVGDWPDRDVVGGNRLGIYTVLARYGTDGHDDLEKPPVNDKAPEDDNVADAELQHFVDLLSVFKRSPRTIAIPRGAHAGIPE